MSSEPRPVWPYAVGALGAAVFAVGAFLLFLLLRAERPGGAGEHAFITLAIGSAALGVGWIGLLKYEQGGFGTVSGCFAVTLSLLYAYMHRNDWSMFAASGTMILLAFAWCATGHLFARGLRMTKFPAGVALLGLLPEIYQTAAKTHFSRGTDQLFSMLTCVGLGVMGLACAFEIFSLRRATNDDNAY